MLEIKIPAQEFYDEQTQEFVNTPERTLHLEHSLISLSKWESKWQKPFLDKNQQKSREETLDYIRFMTLTKNVPPEVYLALTSENLEDIKNYIEAPMTATTFNERQSSTRSSSRGEIVTSELIYYQMIAANIPMECQKWHLNRLVTLIRICSIKNTPPKKMSKAEMLNQRRAINAQRRQQFGNSG